MALLSFKWFIPAILTLLHPLYVSVTEINHNAEEKTLEITCKVFTDDMEDVLEKNYRTTVDLSNEKNQKVSDQLIYDYISKHLIISSNGKKSKLNYVGFEKDSESVYCYLEITGVVNPSKLEVQNSILQDFSNEQMNIIHVTVKGSRKSYKLDYPNKEATFVF